MPFLENIRRSIKRHKLINPGDIVLVGVSGGADSLALMHALWQLQETLQCDLHVATVDHGWRGEQGAADAAFVVEQAQALGLSVTSVKLNLTELQGGLEASSRRARYDFLAKIALEVEANAVAVAHHADDQAETVLMRLLRGAGLHGLAGMGWSSHVPYNPQVRLIRPLLAIRRDDIEAYCLENALHPRYDPTNEDTTFLRNRIRHEALPYLEQYNANIRHALVRLADVASVDEHYLQQQVDDILVSHASTSDARVMFPREQFLKLHPALQRRVLYQLAMRLYAPQIPDVSYEHITAAVRVCKDAETGAFAQFVDGGGVRVGHENLFFEFEYTNSTVQLPLYIEGDAILPTLREQPLYLNRGAVLLSQSERPDYNVAGQVHLPEHMNLSIRSRRAGDRVHLPGMDGKSQKLTHWMTNRKIPVEQRSQVPLLVSEDDEIVAILHVEKGTVCYPYHLPQVGHTRFNLLYSV